MRQKQGSLIHELPFGRARSIQFTDSAIISEKFTERGVGVLEYVASKSQPSFEISLAELRTESCRVVASASTAMQFSAYGFPDAAIFIPFAGSTLTQSNGTWIEWGHAKDAIYLPAGDAKGESSARSVIAIDVNTARLTAIAHAMAGHAEESEHVIDFDAPRGLNLNHGGINFAALFQQYTSLIDAMGSDPDRVERSGLTDAILRAAVMLLAPSLILQPPPPARTGAKAAVSHLCDYIDANLARKITLTELEKISGFSARALQYSFQAVTGRTPVQWIAQRRLEVVRQMILKAEPGTTVTDVVGPYFSNMGEFARVYREQYGELPSETLRRR